MALNSVLDSLLAIPAVAAAGAAVIAGVKDAILTLRAKRRARALLAEKAAADPSVKALVWRSLDEADLHRAAGAISDSLAELSKEDRRRIERGLHQPSRSGERRFMIELVPPS